MTQNIQPDPSVIGGVPKPPFVFLPDPAKLFATRAKRFEFLAQTSDLKPYLIFLGALSRAQEKLVVDLPAPTPLQAEKVKQSLAAKMPPIDRNAALRDPALAVVVAALLQAAASIEMPEPARLALKAVQAATPEDMQWLLQNVLTDTIPEDSVAPHLFVAAAVQVYMARLAATLDAEALHPIRTGICPCCGGAPVSSSVMATQGIESIRYATCGSCATRFNEVRIKCLCCGTNKGLTYQSAETTEASVKAECCAGCHSWVKIFYLGQNPTLDAVADDVGSLGLDMLMKQTSMKRGGYNPYLTGY